MKNTIEEVLIQYRNYTCEIIELLKEDDFDSAQNKVKIRQNVLDEIISMSDKKEEAKMLYEKFKIKEIECEAAKLMKDKASKIKANINNISRNKAATIAYGNLGSSAKIFSKKI